ncbi:histidine-specific methyltransferase [Staphylotrichum tortipilum]|uniref:Histidine-specific methyltransferase n=1 Tax=Staphylotrichum tortipilum TaxID=2831512 RepID=A0AAN6MIX8_9PEZI|nr:histidine-specific methyltransferase [Staphylotrichum longicolle]
MASILLPSQLDPLIRAPTRSTTPQPPRAVPHLHPTASSDTNIINIRSSTECPLDNLGTAIVDGLSQPPGSKSLPALLLWDEKGQTLYDDLLTWPEYYPYRVEAELLNDKIGDITATIALSRADILVELGAGNMSKSSLFLSSLDKRLHAPLVYYALDVDGAQLERSLAQLKQCTTLKWITVCGLLGTYEDGARWLARPELAAFRRTLVWLGNSITNCEEQGASELLEAFSRDPDTGRPQNLAGFLLLVDGCQDAARIELAYDVPSGKSRGWIMHALEAAREHLGGDGDSDVESLLADGNWRFEGRWHPERQRYENYLVPTRPLMGIIGGQLIRLDEGERVAMLGSGKWPEATVSAVAARSGLEIKKAWRNEEFQYGAYWLQPIIRRHDSGIDIAEMGESGKESTKRE